MMYTFRGVFCTFIDKLSGNKVVWFKKGYEEVKLDHREVETHFKTVKEAVENPFCVKQDADYPRRNNYYLPFSGGRDYPNHHMKVVVEKNLLGNLRVITAFFTDGFKHGETIIWNKN